MGRAAQTIALSNGLVEVREGDLIHGVPDIAGELIPEGAMWAGKNLVLHNLDRAITDGSSQFFLHGMGTLESIKTTMDGFFLGWDIRTSWRELLRTGSNPSSYGSSGSSRSWYDSYSHSSSD